MTVKKKARRIIIFSVTLVVLVTSVGCITYKLCNSKSAKNSIEHRTVFQANAQPTNVKVDKPQIRKAEVDFELDDEIKYDRLKKRAKIIKNRNVTTDGLDSTIDRVEVAKMLTRGYKSDGKKYVFLTIDDGPTVQNTAGVLDILKAKDVKATFFVLGKHIATNEGAELLKREFNEGHAIGNHGYSHDLIKLYPGNRVNVDCYINEVKETNVVMKKILGDSFDTKVVRMPGGYMSRVYYRDPNLDTLNSALSKEGLVSIDWNSVNGDAEGRRYSNQEMINYVARTAEGYDKVVLLIHDAEDKLQTRQILPIIIDYFKSRGYEFKTIS